MLTIVDSGGRRFCDGLTRRGMLKIGALGLGFGGMTLADMLRLEAATGAVSSGKSVINLHLEGGPPQMDTWDMKPTGPVEVRGEFRPIETNVAASRSANCCHGWRGWRIAIR